MGTGNVTQMLIVLGGELGERTLQLDLYLKRSTVHISSLEHSALSIKNLFPSVPLGHHPLGQTVSQLLTTCIFLRKR